MPIGSLVDWLIEGAILDALREDFNFHSAFEASILHVRKELHTM